jgi:hypothetical protein
MWGGLFNEPNLKAHFKTAELVLKNSLPETDGFFKNK